MKGATMELGDLLDQLHRIRTGTGLRPPTWAHTTVLRGRTYSPRHVVCIGDSGHHNCLARPGTVPEATFTLGELDANGNGGRRVVCPTSARVAVELDATQLTELEVTERCGAAIVLARYAADAEADGDPDGDAAELRVNADNALSSARALAADTPPLAAFVEQVAQALPHTTVIRGD